MSRRYEPKKIEPRWQAYWAEKRTFRAVEDAARPKYYTLSMFPYPSGAGLHVGHPESYTAVDIVARYKRMRGFAVLNPMGWDAFGLPAERAAVREGRHPAEITRENIANFKRQLLALGFSYDWEREVDTSSPETYRWSQWIFLKLYERGLAYLAEVPVNWCPAQGTVLANEEVQDGRYVETGDPVERRLMKQWMLRITAYAQRLLDDLEGLDWPASVLEMQRQWIGRSEGAEVRFAVDGRDLDFTIFTTRPDTLYGATYCVLSPEHPLVAAITAPSQRAEVERYQAQARNRSDLDRQLAAEKEKTGVATGAFAINPINQERVPIWIADYVLMSYGTGAIMAVPAHDERDHAFARKFGLEIREVISGGENLEKQAWCGEGRMKNSGEFDGLGSAEGRKAVTERLEVWGLGQKRVHYRLRDWLFSRQRYWGEPIPVVHLEDGTVQPLAAEDLPVLLPDLAEFRPTADGQPPLARATDWVRTTYKGRTATRELNTMPQWAGSCWYYLRYMDPTNHGRPFDPAREKYWGPVDLYIGGVEHAVLHLLYARFWHKVLYDEGLVHTKEPFLRLFNQGMILAHSYRDEHGKYYLPSEVEDRGGTFYARGTEVALEVQVEKMSKSLKNVVNPDDVVAEFGADTLRMYEMFMGPLEAVKPWQTSGCDGIHRFLGRVWRVFIDDETGELRAPAETPTEAKRALHLAIKETTEGIEALRFNTPISRMMEFVNLLKGASPAREDGEKLLLILSPYAPHIAEELWQRTGHPDSLAYAPWPAWDPAQLVEDTLEIAVQVMGKLRGTVSVPRDATRDAVLAAARTSPNVVRWLEGKDVAKEVYVPGRLVNFVLRQP